MKGKEKLLFGLQAICFYIQILNLVMIGHQNYAAQMLEVMKWIMRDDQQCYHRRAVTPSLVLIWCPILLCITLPASCLPHPVLQLWGQAPWPAPFPWGHSRQSSSVGAGGLRTAGL